MTKPHPKNPVQNRWVVYDNVEHKFSVYYNEQAAKEEYEARIKQINDDVEGGEYEGEEEVYLASVIAKAEVVQICIADDGDKGLYRLVSYDYSAKESSDKVLEVIDLELLARKSLLESSAMGQPLSERAKGEIIGLEYARKELRQQEQKKERER
jgi:hypothetical protein